MDWSQDIALVVAWLPNQSINKTYKRKNPFTAEHTISKSVCIH